MAQLTQDELDQEFNQHPITGVVDQDSLDHEFKNRPDTPPETKAAATPTPQAAEPPTSDADLATIAAGGIPPDEMLGDASRLGSTVKDAAVSTGNSIPFATRGLSAAEAAVNAARGNGYDYSGRYQKNNDYINALRAQYPSFNAGPLGQISGFDAMGAIGSSLIPMGAASKIVGGAGNLASKVVKSALAGGGMGLAQGVSSSPDLSDWQQDLTHGATGLGLGLATGAAIPAVSTAAGKLANKFSEWRNPSTIPNMTPEASQALTTALQNGRSTISPNIQQDMNNLGSQGALGDVNPMTRGQVTSLASTPGDHLDNLQGAFQNRDPGQVIRSAVADPVNGLPPLTQTQLEKATELRNQQSDFGQNVFKPAMDAAGPISGDKISPILDDINDKINHSTGPTQAALAKIRDSLTAQRAMPGKEAIPGVRQMVPGTEDRAQPIWEVTKGTPEVPPTDAVPTTDPQKLHSTVMQIDNLANYGDGAEIQRGSVSATNGAIGDVRKSLSGVLKNDIPNYSDAMDQYSGLYKQRQALNDGSEVDLAPGGGSAKDFISQYNAMSPEEQEAKKIGMNDYIQNNLASKANDVSSMNTMLQGMGPSGNNYQKIAHVFGSNVADNLSNSVQNAAKITAGNSAFNAGQKAMQGSAAKDLSDTLEKMGTHEPYFKGNLHDLTTHGMVASGAEHTANALIDALRTPKDPTTMMSQLSSAYSMKNGTPLQNLLAEALRRAPILAKNQQFGNNVRNATGRLMGGLTIPPAVALSNGNRGNQ